MARLSLIALLIVLCTNHLEAQRRIHRRELQKHERRKAESALHKRVIWSLDTIFVNGKSYATLKEKKQIPNSEFVVHSLNGERLIEISTVGGEADPFYHFQFIESSRTVNIRKEHRRKPYQLLVENQLITDDGVDPYREMLFFIHHSIENERNVKTELNSSDVYQTVSRNRSSPFYAREGRILQDYREVGSYKLYDSLFRIYLPNKILIAEMKQSGTRLSECPVTVIKDHKTYLVMIRKEKELEDLIDYLCEKGVL